MLLSYFKEEAYDKLFYELDKNKPQYRKKGEWLDSYFGTTEYKKKSSVDVGMFSPFYTPGPKTDAQRTEEDLINVRGIYDAMHRLTPLQATNKYMWTCLCHTVPEYREYISDRWMNSEGKNTILTRYFVTNTKSSLFDNALSRLWWIGYLTYDESQTNHYALTEIALTNQTICTDFLDTYNSKNPTRAKGVLSALKAYIDERGTTVGLSDDFRACNKYLNRYAAVSNFDVLLAENIMEITLSYLRTLH